MLLCNINGIVFCLCRKLSPSFTQSSLFGSFSQQFFRHSFVLLLKAQNCTLFSSTVLVFLIWELYQSCPSDYQHQLGWNCKHNFDAQSSVFLNFIQSSDIWWKNSTGRDWFLCFTLCWIFFFQKAFFPHFVLGDTRGTEETVHFCYWAKFLSKIFPLAENCLHGFFVDTRWNLENFITKLVILQDWFRWAGSLSCVNCMIEASWFSIAFL